MSPVDAAILELVEQGLTTGAICLRLGVSDKQVQAVRKANGRVTAKTARGCMRCGELGHYAKTCKRGVG